MLTKKSFNDFMKNKSFYFKFITLFNHFMSPLSVHMIFDHVLILIFIFIDSKLLKSFRLSLNLLRINWFTKTDGIKQQININ